MWIVLYGYICKYVENELGSCMLGLWGVGGKRGSERDFTFFCVCVLSDLYNKNVVVGF